MCIINKVPSNIHKLNNEIKMINKIKIAYKIFIIALFNSCWMDSNPKIFNLKNESKRNIVAFVFPDSVYSDQTLYHLYGTQISPNATYEYHGVVSKKFFLYVFDSDSVDKYIKAKKIDGIVQKSFLCKRKLFIDSINKSDTLIFKTQLSVTFNKK